MRGGEEENERLETGSKESLFPYLISTTPNFFAATYFSKFKTGCLRPK